MPSRADVDALTAALNNISDEARGSLLQLLGGIDLTSPKAIRAALATIWPELVGSYGEMAGTVGADVFEAWAYDLGLRPRLVNVPSVDPARAGARMRWAAGQPDAVGSMLVLLDELVKQPARSLIHKSATASGGGWARVPSGSETCRWCLIMASRGGVYHTAQTAGRDRKYHGDCDCQPTLVRSPADYPKGYDPVALYDQYSIARGATTGALNDRTIAASMRNLFGGH